MNPDRIENNQKQFDGIHPTSLTSAMSIAGMSDMKSGNPGLTSLELQALVNLAAGKRLRGVDIDRLVSLGMAERDIQTGNPQLTQAGRAALELSGIECDHQAVLPG